MMGNKIFSQLFVLENCHSLIKKLVKLTDVSSKFPLMRVNPPKHCKNCTVTLNCQATKIVMNSGSQLSEL